jgi:5-methylcytosine-specific restriction endonuclease McrA
MDHARPLAAIPDEDLLRRLVELLRQSRRVESDLVAHIAEVELRRLYAREAAPSMFAYSTQVLRLSEAEAYMRITVARASLQHPMILDMLADGRIHLTGIARLAPHLTLENRDEFLGRATHKSRRQIEELIAEIAPRPDVVALMRRLPERKGLTAPVVPVSAAGPALERPELCPDRVESGSLTLRPEGGPVSVAPAAGAPAPSEPLAASQPLAPGRAASVVGQASAPAVVQPLGNARYKVQFTASAALHHKLERLRALMRSQIPDGDLSAIIECAVSEQLERLESRRFAKTSRPRRTLDASDTAPSSRRIPAAVRRAVYDRDGGRCRYVAAGRRCSERDRLEYHHRHPFGMGGDHRLSNISLMCRAHNALLAEQDYGRASAARGSRLRPHRPAPALDASGHGQVARNGPAP